MTDLKEPLEHQERMDQEGALDVKDHPEHLEMPDQMESRDLSDQEDEVVKTVSQDLLDLLDHLVHQDYPEVLEQVVSTFYHHSETQKKDPHTKDTNTTVAKMAKISRPSRKKLMVLFSLTSSNLMRSFKPHRNQTVADRTQPSLVLI